MTIESLLAAYGVDSGTLPAATERQLDERGYVVLPDLIGGRALERLRALFDGKTAGTGTVQLPALAIETDVVDGLYDHPLLLACVHRIIRADFGVLNVGGRAPLPGFGLQGLHADWMTPGGDGPYHAATALVMIDAFTGNNGATRVVPGSHRESRPLPKSMQQPQASHPEQLVVTGSAGSILCFNGHLWHGGTKNDSRAPRRSIQIAFVARDARQGALGSPTIARPLGEAARRLLSTHTQV